MITKQENKMKTVYLVRHGAYDRDSGALTSRGESEIKQTGELLAEKINGLEEITIYHSPKKRAMESALVLVAALHSLPKIKINLERAEELACEEYHVGKLVNKINNTAILVSHQPDLETYLKSIGIEVHLNTADFYELNKN
jgi:phosphohistidine phosphatase SixA